MSNVSLGLLNLLTPSKTCHGTHDLQNDSDSPEAIISAGNTLAEDKGRHPREVLFWEAALALFHEKKKIEGKDDGSKLDFTPSIKKYEELWKKFPLDAEAGTMYAWTMMNAHDFVFLWDKKDRPKKYTKKIIQVLNDTLKINRRHPGANHFFIHAYEASGKAMMASSSCNNIHTYVPIAGHYAHMPSHIYIKTGRILEAIESNKKAIEQDRKYFAQGGIWEGYGQGFHLHNYYFLWDAAVKEGDMTLAKDTADTIMKMTNPKELEAVGPYRNTLPVLPLYNMMLTSDWHQILRVAKNSYFEDYPFIEHTWRWARAHAFLAKGDRGALAHKELKFMEAITNSIMVEDKEKKKHKKYQEEFKNLFLVMKIQQEILNAHLVGNADSKKEAYESIKKALRYQDQLSYTEPSDLPTTVDFMAALFYLRLKDYKLAERYFRADLKKFPDNAWSLYGLRHILEAAQKHDQLRKVPRYQRHINTFGRFTIGELNKGPFYDYRR